MDKITIIEGQAKGTSYPLNENDIHVGRARECQIRLPESDVSRHHLNITSDGSGWRVTDARGTEQVNVNGDMKASHILKDGDKLRVGGFCVLKFEAAPPASASGRETKTAAAPNKVETSPEASTLPPTAFPPG